jgi:hypothetical protein
MVSALESGVASVDSINWIETMSDIKEFRLREILTVTTGIILAGPGIDCVYKILNHLTGDSLFTHQLSRVCREVKPLIIEQIPILSDSCLEKSMQTLNELLDKTEDRQGKVDIIAHYMSALERAFGEYHKLRVLPDGSYNRIEPISELAEMMD